MTTSEMMALVRRLRDEADTLARYTKGNARAVEYMRDASDVIASIAQPASAACVVVERVPCRCQNDRPTIDGEVGCARCVDSPFGPTWLARRVRQAQ